MLRSMFAGVSGLKAHQMRMDVIGNNIANVNTAGYKACLLYTSGGQSSYPLFQPDARHLPQD